MQKSSSYIILNGLRKNSSLAPNVREEIMQNPHNSNIRLINLAMWDKFVFVNMSRTQCGVNFYTVQIHGNTDTNGHFFLMTIPLIETH